ncbi:hypothetical protein DPEC_G00350460 [Dallia pectoralis]|uniref:Uncharacterized protein n=1 Tax=Dallia pectoralis TaxID=75939 RepID=A0ACC2F1Q7_DALPE|nr:hypothetical protein DPEC_G00350460 [Dallia pectoralis]
MSEKSFRLLEGVEGGAVGHGARSLVPLNLFAFVLEQTVPRWAGVLCSLALFLILLVFLTAQQDLVSLWSHDEHPHPIIGNYPFPGWSSFCRFPMTSESLHLHQLCQYLSLKKWLLERELKSLQSSLQGHVTIPVATASQVAMPQSPGGNRLLSPQAGSTPRVPDPVFRARCRCFRSAIRRLWQCTPLRTEEAHLEGQRGSTGSSSSSQ